MSLIIFEDEHLLVVNKPAGWNTHSPAPHAGEGLYEWLKNREPRWERLAIIHRLDKETSGLIVFGKTAEANRSLTEQFEKRQVQKTYILLTDRPAPAASLRVKSALARAGDHYESRAVPAAKTREASWSAPFRGAFPKEAEMIAETRFSSGTKTSQGIWQVEAEPLTGKTHQIRVHAAANHFPILGDVLYGGTPAQRVCLHAAEITFKHPTTGKEISFSAPPNFEEDSRLAVRTALIDSAQTDSYRMIHGGADGWPGLYIDRLGEFVLAQTESSLTNEQSKLIERIPARGIYHKTLQREARDAPQWLKGEKVAGEFIIRENGLKFAMRFDEGYSTGLFLDQRDNRRRFLTGYVAPKLHLPAKPEVLNTFAYTCGFSVAAAKAGGRVLSLDLSKKYLDWGKHNFVLNGLNPGEHDFIFGDTFDWMKRLAKKKRLFDIIVLDPPTFSRSKESGVFQAEKNFGMLIATALPILKPGGFILASTNAATLVPEKFLDSIEIAVGQSRRRLKAKHYVPQPPDFPVHRSEPAYLKTVWLLID